MTLTPPAQKSIARRPVAFVSLEAWDDVWRRNQFIVAGLASRAADRRIVFVTPPHDVSNRVRRLDVAGTFRKTGPVETGYANVEILTPTKWLPNTLGPARSINAIGLRRRLRGATVTMRRPILWINDQTAAHLVGRLGESAVVYDITDDWIAFDQPAAVRERVRVDDATLCRRADVVIVCSQRLYEMKLPLVGPDRLHLIPNGVDADHYATVRDRSLPLPEAARAWPSPVFGYTGTVHPDRVDVSLIETLARSLTAGCIVLVGPNHLLAADQARLLATGRVFVPGPVPYRELPNYMRAFDVCIVPHRMTAFTESLNPIKLWEYLAAGKPIVSTDVAGFRDYPLFVRIARDADAFGIEMAAALTEPPEVGSRRVDEARRHSWAIRVDAVETVLAAIEDRSDASGRVSDGR